MERAFVILVFLAFAPAGPAQDKSKGKPVRDVVAEAIVRKAIAAHGGRDALAKHATVRFAIKGTIIVGKTENPFTGVVTTSAPDKYRLEMEAILDKQKYTVTEVVNGTHVKSVRQLGGLPYAELSDAERDDLIASAAVQEVNQLYPLLEPKRFTLKSAPDEDVNGKPAAGVMAVFVESKKEVKLLFDRETGLLVMTSRKGLGPGENGPVEVVQDAVMSGFKVFDGIKVATSVRVRNDGKPFMRFEVTGYSHVDKPDPKLFETDG